MYAQKYLIRLPMLIATSLILVNTTVAPAAAQPAGDSGAPSAAAEESGKILKEKKTAYSTVTYLPGKGRKILLNPDREMIKHAASKYEI